MLYLSYNTQSSRAMYEWSYENLVELPDDEEYESCNGEHLDENYAGDVHNLDELARKPQAWYNNLVEILPCSSSYVNSSQSKT